ncbi:unnamed protein product [Peniophora sp. CBMAI 1063]|nr:unnamed protein product [Peniophora sp. CBMAI 1063]
MHRLFNHKKGNSISTTTPSSTAVPSSAKSTPAHGSGHRRNHSAAPVAAPYIPLPKPTMIKPTGMFKPAPAPVPIPDPAIRETYANNELTKPFFATLEDGYLDDVPDTVPVNIAPRHLIERDALGRRKEPPVMSGTVRPSQRTQGAAHPARFSATVSGQAAQDTKTPPSSRPKHRAHLSDSAIQLLSPRSRADSPLPHDIAGKPRTIRKTGALDGPLPKTVEPVGPPRESVYLDDVHGRWLSSYAVDPLRPHLMIKVLNAAELDVFKRVYKAGRVKLGPGRNFWIRLWNEEPTSYMPRPLNPHVFVPSEVREAIEELVKEGEEKEKARRRVTRPPPGSIIDDDLYINTNLRQVYKPSASAAVKRVARGKALPPIPKPPPPKDPNAWVPPPPSRGPGPCRKPGMFSTGKYRESGWKVPAHIDYGYDWLPLHLHDMTSEELDVLYDILRDKILYDCTCWKSREERIPSRMPGGTVRTIYNNTLRNTINQNLGISMRHAQRLALEKVLAGIQDLPYDKLDGPYVQEYEFKDIYKEVLVSIEEREEKRQKEVRRGNVARTAVAVPPGAKPPADYASRPLSHF